MLTTVLQSIGNTPLLQLSPLCSDLPGRVWLKLENCNPGGSIKDRVAFHMVDRALDRGDVLPGGTLVEATSGNLGIGLALVSAVRGLKCVLTMPETMSIERRRLLAALGAEVVLTPAADGMEGALKAADRLSALIKCTEEVQAGNREFASALAQQKAAITAMHCPEADYFLEHMLPCYAQNLDELTRAEEG